MAKKNSYTNRADRKKICRDMLYLISTILNKKIPDEKIIWEMDLEKVYKYAQFHSLTAITCMALELTSIFEQKESDGIVEIPCDLELLMKWKEEKEKAICKEILLDIEREKLFEFMDKSQIWHMSLKGCVLKSLYPQIGMRQMADNDILCDALRNDEVKNI